MKHLVSCLGCGKLIENAAKYCSADCGCGWDQLCFECSEKEDK